MMKRCGQKGYITRVISCYTNRTGTRRILLQQKLITTAIEVLLGTKRTIKRAGVQWQPAYPHVRNPILHCRPSGSPTCPLWVAATRTFLTSSSALRATCITWSATELFQCPSKVPAEWQLEVA
ncbi:unnamed protein product [Nezara viridula]|uniref:Uncharacterized protein n=1 Tax=Nezara viridula TaxID=85310 RepID=A0A9P0HN69_NEZVI|nr:unnamed protein product [Nezara viridula]